jgi:hypothetical protein
MRPYRYRTWRLFGTRAPDLAACPIYTTLIGPSSVDAHAVATVWACTGAWGCGVISAGAVTGAALLLPVKRAWGPTN